MHIMPKFPWLSRHVSQPITAVSVLLDNELVSILINMQVFGVDHDILSFAEDLCDLLEWNTFGFRKVEDAKDAA